MSPPVTTWPLDVGFFPRRDTPHWMPVSTASENTREYVCQRSSAKRARGARAAPLVVARPQVAVLLVGLADGVAEPPQRRVAEVAAC